jgi:hypothetical protein
LAAPENFFGVLESVRVRPIEPGKNANGQTECKPARAHWSACPGLPYSTVTDLAKFLG